MLKRIDVRIFKAHQSDGAFMVAQDVIDRDAGLATKLEEVRANLHEGPCAECDHLLAEVIMELKSNGE